MIGHFRVKSVNMAKGYVKVVLSEGAKDEAYIPIRWDRKGVHNKLFERARDAAAFREEVKDRCERIFGNNESS